MDYDGTMLKRHRTFLRQQQGLLGQRLQLRRVHLRFLVWIILKGLRLSFLNFKIIFKIEVISIFPHKNKILALIYKNRMFIGNSHDICYLIANKLIDKDMLRFFSINKYLFRLSQNEIFWINKCLYKYPDIGIYKSTGRKWKHFYIAYSKYLYLANKTSLSEKYTDNLIYLAAKNADMDFINYFMLGSPSIMYGMYGASESGDLAVVQFFSQKGAHCWNNAMSRAALYGHRNLVDYFISRGAKIWNWGLQSAIEGNHTELIEFFQEKLEKIRKLKKIVNKNRI